VIKGISGPTNKTGADAVREKVERLLFERSQLVESWRGNTSALRDAAAAGRLFGVDIQLPSDIDVGAPDGVAPQPSLFGVHGGEITIREAVLDQLKMAGDNGVKAARIRRVIENMIGRQLHFKTIGMTLYRLSEKGLARRDGYVWFYRPEGAKTKTPA